MTGTYRYGAVAVILCIILAIAAGCSGNSGSSQTPSPTPTPHQAKYVAGDVVAKSSSSTDQPVVLIISYDSANDQYTRAWILKKNDGSWGYRTSDKTETASRAIVEQAYPVRITQVNVASVPVITPTIVMAAPTTLSGSAPSVSAVSPAYGGKDATVSVTITGTNFVTGATTKLMQPGSPSIPGTAVSVASGTQISSTFKLFGADKGKYSVVVLNPDGQKGSLTAGFTIGEAPPMISDVSPSSGELNDTVSIQIGGQNFKEGVKVSFVKDSSELICNNPVSISGTKIKCDLCIKPPEGARFGEWVVKVLNIDGQLSGTWSKKFTIKNATQSSSD